MSEGLLTEQNLANIRALDEIARRRGQTLAQMALSWVLRDPRVTTALIGASHPGQIAENAKAASQADFSDAEIAKLNALLAKVDLPPSLWAGE